MDLENTLAGENLVFYRNIQDLKVLTVNARALISRSHALYNDIIQGEEFKKRLRGTEVEEDDTSDKSFHGECPECGLLHGAHDFCIVREIIAAEKKRGERSRKSGSLILPDQENAEQEKRIPSSQPSRLKPTREKVEKWENLLYREMDPEELKAEHSKICYQYGVKTGEKFLLARSLAQEAGEVELLFTEDDEGIARRKNYQKGKSKMTSITRDCVPQKKLGFPGPCSDLSPDVRIKMASVVDLEPPCKTNSPKVEKLWKEALKAKPRKEVVDKETVEDEYSSSPSNTHGSSEYHSDLCGCGLVDCECGIVPKCNPPRKVCPTSADYRNNYLLTIREKMNKRRILKGKTPPAGFHLLRKLSSKEATYDVLRKDSELMVRKANSLHEKELKECIKSAIGKEDSNLNRNVSKVAEITSAFTKPDEKVWDKWIEGFLVQNEIEDDEGISSDSDIPATLHNSMTSSTTDREFENPLPSMKRIPYFDEPLKLVDILFDKIHAQFKKTVQNNSTRPMHNPVKRIFFSHVDLLNALKYKNSIAGEIADKLNLHYLYLKSLKPKKIRKDLRFKKLKAKRKALLRTIKKRQCIEGIQVGKHYRPTRKSMNFTKAREYVGLKPVHQELLKKPTPERFRCDLVGDDSNSLLSEKRIHYQYRLLRTLFNGPIESEDQQSLMDEGMKERLREFKKTLHDSSKYCSATEEETEDEVMLKTSSVPIRRPAKKDEKKLKSAPGWLRAEKSSRRGSGTVTRRLNCYGNESILFEGACKSTASPKPSRRLSSPVRSNRPGLLSHKFSSEGNSRDSPDQSSHWRNTQLLQRCRNSSQMLTSAPITPRTRSDNTEASTSIKKSKGCKNTNPIAKPGPFCLPTPPLSDSSCDETGVHSIKHRVPPKEEAHMEKSARGFSTDVDKPEELDGSELTDGSSDSYVPKLLRIPPKRISTHPGSSGVVGGHLKNVRGRARSSYISESSSSDTEPVNRSRNIHRERHAWDRKSGTSREVAPYIDKNAYPEHDVPSEHPQYNEPQGTRNKKKFTSPLPKAGPSILKKSSLPKPPSDGTTENLSKTPVTGAHPVRRQSFSDSSYRTTSWPSERLIKPARVVTERLLKATEGTPEDVPTGSTKLSVLSRATPEAVPISSVSTGGSKKLTGSAQLGLSKSGQIETDNDDPSPLQHPSITIKEPTDASTSHRSGYKSPEGSLTHAVESSRFPPSGSLTASSSKRLSRRISSKVVSEVFRQRSLAHSEHEESMKKEPQAKTKPLKKAGADENLQNTSDSSMVAKLKKLEAIGPTKRRLFNLDIGQGINCVNYLKENAPGADEMKKKELVDLLVTQVEVKRTPKKAPPKIEQEVSLNSAVVTSQESSREPTSASLVSANPSAKTMKIQTQTVGGGTPLRKDGFKTLDQIYKEVHGINKNNTPRKLLDRDYEYECKTRQQLTKHKIP